MESHIEEVKETLGQCQARYRAQVVEMQASLAAELQPHYRRLAKYALLCLDDVLESAIERHEYIARRVVERKCVEVGELADFDEYLLTDLSRTIEFCDMLALKFLRQWEGLH